MTDRKLAHLYEAGSEEYAKTRTSIDAGNCPECGRPLTPCRHTEFHGTRPGSKTAGDCGPCGACYTFERLPTVPAGATTGFDVEDERIIGPLKEGLCPDCGTKLIPCAHIVIHLARGDDTIHGDCTTCHACWTEGPEEPGMEIRT